MASRLSTTAFPRWVPAGTRLQDVTTPGASASRVVRSTGVGPSDIPGLDGQVELIADKRSCRPAVGGRPVSGSCVRIDRVALATIGAHSEHLGPTDGPFCSRLGPPSGDLGLRRFTIEVDGDGVAVQCAPGLDVSSVDRHGAAGE